MANGCVGCGSPLEPGFLEDSGESTSGFIKWIRGPLEKGMFGGARRWGRQRVDVHAHRCTGCGLLALYAGGSPEATADQRTRMSRHRLEQREEGDAGGLTPPSPSPFYGG